MSYAYAHLTSPQNVTSGIAEHVLVAPASWFATNGIKSPGTSSGIGDEVIVSETHQFLPGKGFVKFGLAPEKNAYSADQSGDKGFSKLAHSVKIMLPGSNRALHEAMKNLLQEPGLIVLVKDASCGLNMYYQMGCDCQYAWLSTKFGTGTTKEGNKGYDAELTYHSESVVIYAGDILLPMASTASLTDTARTQTTITMTWAAIPEATNYTLQRSATADFASVTTVYSGPNLTYQNTGRTANTTYYYRVRGEAVGHTNGDWVTDSATTNAMTQLATPSGLAVSNIANNGFDVSCTAVANATQYEVELSTFSNFSSVTSAATISSNSGNMYAPTPNTDWYWRIRAKASGYTTSNWAVYGSAVHTLS